MERNEEDDQVIVEHKMYPLYKTEYSPRPLFPGACPSCTPDGKTSLTDPVLQTLALMNILEDWPKLDKLNGTVRGYVDQLEIWTVVQYLKRFQSNITVLPGQLEVLCSSVEAGTPCILLCSNLSVISILSLCLAAKVAGVSSIAIQIEGWSGGLNRYQRFLFSLLAVQFEEDQIEDVLQDPSALRAKLVITENTPQFIKAIVNTKQVLMLSQGVVREVPNGIRVELDQPFHIQQFITAPHTYIGTSAVDSLEGHLKYSRVMMEKPSLADCLRFLMKYHHIIPVEELSNVVEDEEEAREDQDVQKQKMFNENNKLDLIIKDQGSKGGNDDGDDISFD